MFKNIIIMLITINVLSFQLSDMIIAAQNIQHQSFEVKSGSKDDSFISLAQPVLAQQYIPEVVTLEDQPVYFVQSNMVMSNDEPKVVYNVQGKKISEHYFNDDGSEHYILYEEDGNIVTTVFDAHKVKQQEITLKLDTSSVTKFYNEQGKLEEIKTKLVNGSVFTKRVHEGDMISAQVLDKNGQLEGQTHRDDYGNIMTTQQYPDGTSTDLIRYRQYVVNNDGGGATITTYDSVGVSTVVVKNNENILISKKNYDADGKMIFELFFDNNGNKKEVTYFLNGQRLQETYDTHNNIILSEKYYASGQVKLKISYYLNGDKEIIKIDCKGKVTSKKIYNVHQEVIDSEDYYASGKIKLKVFYDHDGHQEKLSYDLKGKLATKEVYNLDGKILYSDSYYADGKIKMQIVYHIDGSQDKLHYNNKGNLTLRELYDASGKKTSSDW